MQAMLPSTFRSNACFHTDLPSAAPQPDSRLLCIKKYFSATYTAARLEATLPGSLRANAFLPRFQPPFQCFRTFIFYIALPVFRTYLLQVLGNKKMQDAKSR